MSAEIRNTMISKKETLMIVSALAGVAIILCMVGYSMSHKTTPAPAPSPAFGTTQVQGFVDTNNNSGATTTLTYVSSVAATASTTLAAYTQATNALSLNLFAVATSTSACLQWSYSFSNNNMDWYYQGPVFASTTQLTPAPALYIWCPSYSGTSTKDVLLPQVASKYTRVEMHSFGGAGFNLYAQMVLNNISQN